MTKELSLIRTLKKALEEIELGNPLTGEELLKLAIMELENKKD